MWKALVERMLSPQTARFILALLALGCAAFGANKLLDDGDDAGQAAIFAVGQLFGLALLAFTYYFGSTAKRDDETPAGTPENPVVVEGAPPPARPVVTTNEEENGNA